MCTYTVEIPMTYWKGLRSFVLKANKASKAQMKLIFLYLEPLPLNTNIKLSNNKTTAILLDRIKRPIARLLLLLLLSLGYVKWETLAWTKKFLLLKILTDPRYCKRLTGISNRERLATLLSRYKICNKQY